MKPIPVRAGEWQPRAGQRVAVLVPCFNEEATIAKVVADFRAALPEAAIYVYDNNSVDGTVDVARAAGATVRREMHQGKGNVVRRMFADVDADVFVLVDGDATYDVPSVKAMIARLLDDRLDMVVAARTDSEAAAYRPGHRTGNRLLAAISLVLAIPIVVTYLEQGIVPRLPTAVLSTGLMLVAFLSIASGLILDTVTRGRREMKLLAYLAQGTPADDGKRH